MCTETSWKCRKCSLQSCWEDQDVRLHVPSAWIKVKPKEPLWKMFLWLLWLLVSCCSNSRLQWSFLMLGSMVYFYKFLWDLQISVRLLNIGILFFSFLLDLSFYIPVLTFCYAVCLPNTIALIWQNTILLKLLFRRFSSIVLILHVTLGRTW